MVGGTIFLNANQTLYVCVGGQGGNGVALKDSAGGYNGGGKGTNDKGQGLNGVYDDEQPETSGGGGGATHIATTLIGNGTLVNYVDNKDDVLVVAGGGGGASFNSVGGLGGGQNGGTNSHTRTNVYPTQTSGYQFGKGQDGVGIGYSNGVAGGRRRLVWWLY